MQIILLFRQHYGMTPVAFIRDLRIRKAKHLMESTSNSLQSIADQCGFYDYSQFYKAFCKEASVSPAIWRSRIRRTPIR